jgi:Ca2+-binding RTX toxin-like protein
MRGRRPTSLVFACLLLYTGFAVGPHADASPSGTNVSIVAADAFAAAVPIGLGGTYEFGMNGATVEVGEPTTCASSTAPGTVWFSFEPSATTAVTLAAEDVGSPILAVYTGSTLPSLDRVVCNDANSDSEIEVSFVGVAGMTYWIQYGATPYASGTIRLVADSSLTGAAQVAFDARRWPDSALDRGTDWFTVDSVAIHEDLIAVGVRSLSTPDSVFALRYDGANWSGSEVTTGDAAGLEVDVYGDRIAVARTRFSGSSTPTGVFVFVTDEAGGWVQEARLALPQGSGFGSRSRISMWDDRIVVAADGVFVFEHTASGGWSHTATLDLPAGYTTLDADVWGDRIAVGGWAYVGSDRHAIAYLFDASAAGWKRSGPFDSGDPDTVGAVGLGDGLLVLKSGDEIAGGGGRPTRLYAFEESDDGSWQRARIDEYSRTGSVGEDQFRQYDDIAVFGDRIVDGYWLSYWDRAEEFWDDTSRLRIHGKDGGGSWVDAVTVVDPPRDYSTGLGTYDGIGKSVAIWDTRIVAASLREVVVFDLHDCEGLVPNIIGTPGDDELGGTDEPDVIIGLAGSDDIEGMGGDDTICGGPGHDDLIGGLGDDVLSGEEGMDHLWGGDGDDLLKGGPETDIAYGGPGNDKVRGGGGGDFLYGQEGSDRLLPDTGNDRIDGGPGSDLVDMRSAKNPVIVDLLAGELTLVSTSDTMTLFAIEKVNGSRFADTIRGDNRRNVLRGKQGNDQIWGFDGDDDLIGGLDEDEIWGGPGFDLVKGQAHDDSLWGDAGDDKLVGGHGNDGLVGGPGDDLLIGGLKRHLGTFTNTLDGGDGTDTCRWEAITLDCNP